MKPEERKKLKQKTMEEIKKQKNLISSLAETSKPVAPDNAIGRLTRMEALNSRSISEASLNSAKTKLAQLETALEKIDQPNFGLCAECSNPIPLGRIMLMPENILCLPCAEKK